jgi:hypothetical protein
VADPELGADRLAAPRGGTFLRRPAHPARHDRGLELGFNYVTALITLEAGTWLLVGILMLDGAATLWREDTHRS